MKQTEIQEEKSLQSKVEEQEKIQKYAFFIGCTIKIRIPYIERLARLIFEKMGIELVDLDFSCCPTARIIKDLDIDSWLVIAARNLALAEKADLPIVSMCTGCTQTLVEAKHMLEDKDIQDRVNKQLEQVNLRYEGTSAVKFYAQLLYENKELIEEQRKRELRLTIASHPGCHILRPSQLLRFDDPENPKKLDLLIGLTGADALEYSQKGLCCGFPIYDIDLEAAEQMMKDKITSLHGADCMTVLCPTCFEYYELRQRGVAQKLGFSPVMVLHFLQLLGLSLGLSQEDAGFQYLKYKDDSVLDKLSLNNNI